MTSVQSTLLCEASETFVHELFAETQKDHKETENIVSLNISLLQKHTWVTHRCVA